MSQLKDYRKQSKITEINEFEIYVKNGADVEPLNRLAIFPFFEKTQLKRFKRKYMGKQMKIYISTDGASYLKRFLPRYFFMSIFLMALGIFVFLVPYISS